MLHFACKSTNHQGKKKKNNNQEGMTNDENKNKNGNGGKQELNDREVRSNFAVIVTAGEKRGARRIIVQMTSDRWLVQRLSSKLS
jgi:hypothetical protein